MRLITGLHNCTCNNEREKLFSLSSALVPLKKRNQKKNEMNVQGKKKQDINRRKKKSVQGKEKRTS